MWKVCKQVNGLQNFTSEKLQLQNIYYEPNIKGNIQKEYVQRGMVKNPRWQIFHI